MLLNTGNRTDIPAYFSEWFFNRLKAGYVCARSPYNPNRITKFRLSPDVMDCIVFCTKNPAPMLPRLNELRGFRQFWFVTITPYGAEIEPNVPPKTEVLESFRQLANRVGAAKTAWRYDPVFINKRYTLAYHLETFARMAKQLSGHTTQCIISFIDLYEKTKRNFPQARTVTPQERLKFGKEVVRICGQYGMELKTCCEGTELAAIGADCQGCLTQNVLERALGLRLALPKKQPARDGCTCLLENDIGAYNTCPHGCIYCYANYDRKTVIANLKLHNPLSPLLIGEIGAGDIVKNARQHSYIDRQIDLF